MVLSGRAEAERGEGLRDRRAPRARGLEQRLLDLKRDLAVLACEDVLIDLLRHPSRAMPEPFLRDALRHAGKPRAGMSRCAMARRWPSSVVGLQVAA